MYQVVQNIKQILNKVKKNEKETQPELKIGSIENEDEKNKFCFGKSTKPKHLI